MLEQIIIVICQAKVYADKLNDAPLTRSPVQCATCKTAVTFTDDDLLLDSKHTIVCCLLLNIFEGKWLIEF